MTATSHETSPSFEEPQEPVIKGLAYGPERRLLPQHVSGLLRHQILRKYQIQLPDFVEGNLFQASDQSDQPDTSPPQPNPSDN